MKKHLLRNVLGVVVTAVILGLFATLAGAQGEPCSACGPGDHWIDTCPAGQDQIKQHWAAKIGIDQDLDCVADISLQLGHCPGSLLIINRSDPYEGNPVGDPGHLNTIDTEIISMCLAKGDITLIAGAGLGQGGNLAPSLGAIEEKAGDPAVGKSFFDVFFEVDLGGGQYVYNQTPLRVAAEIECVPPKIIYIKSTGCLPLYTSPIPGEGMHIANMTTALHPTNVPTLTQWGLIILLVVLAGIATWVVLKRRRAVTA